jgi:hypothetical protein
MSGDGSPPGGDEERRTPGRDVPEGWAPEALEVPDDARALDGDRAAWLAELAARRRGGEREHLRPDQPSEPGAVAGSGRPGAGPLGLAALVALAAVALAATMVVALGLRLPVRPAAAPLARTALEPGRVGGLLPDAPVRGSSGSTRSVRDLRPAVLALVPPGCDCPEELREAGAQTREFGLRFWAVGVPDVLPEVVTLLRRSGTGSAGLLADVEGQLAATYSSGASGGLTLVLVHVDGVVGEVFHDVRAPLRAELALARLPEPGAR